MEWISVKDRLPNEGESVIAYSKNTGNQFIASYYTLTTAWGKKYHDAWLIETDDDNVCVAEFITHWQPLTEPPKQ